MPVSSVMRGGTMPPSLTNRKRSVTSPFLIFTAPTSIISHCSGLRPAAQVEYDEDLIHIRHFRFALEVAFYAEDRFNAGLLLRLASAETPEPRVVGDCKRSMPEPLPFQTLCQCP